jgi:MYXO-CTERM domain-containing protein
LNYLFEAPGYGHHKFTELNFLAYPEDLSSNWNGSTTGYLPFAEARSEETVEVHFTDQGLGHGRAHVEISPVAFASGQKLDVDSLESGSTLTACAQDVAFTVHYGEDSQERHGNFKVTMQKNPYAGDNIKVDLEYDFNSTKPVEELNLHLKSEDLKACNLAVAVNFPANMELTVPYADPSLGDPPVLPPEDGTPGDDGTPGLEEPMPEPGEDGIRPGVDAEIDRSGGDPSVADSGTEFRPEHFVNEERGDANGGSGAGVSGGSGGFISCTLQGVGSSPVDLWMLFALALGAIPLLRRRA